MPSKTKAQHNLMAMVANDPAASKRLGIPQKVGKEFMQADKGRKFNQGGEMKESKAMMGKEIAFMKKKGAPKSMIKHEMAEMKGMKHGGKAYAAGGLAAGHKAADGIAKKGKTRGMEVTMKGSTGMKAGGKVKKMNYGGKC